MTFQRSIINCIWNITLKFLIVTFSQINEVEIDMSFNLAFQHLCNDLLNYLVLMTNMQI